MAKIRKQIYIDQWQEEAISKLAKKIGMSEAEIVRKALEDYLIKIKELPKDHPLSDLAGIGASKKGDFGASGHDKDIYKW